MKCPGCGCPTYYVGLKKVECASIGCSNYSEEAFRADLSSYEEEVEKTKTMFKWGDEDVAPTLTTGNGDFILYPTFTIDWSDDDADPPV